MTLVIALHKIGVDDPDAGVRHSGRYDDEGNAIMRKATRKILPGEFFEPADAATLQHLLNLGAVRHPTDGELAVMQRSKAAKERAK